VLKDGQPVLTLIDKEGEDPTGGMAAAYELK
jgi:hypothetical protein